MNCCTLTNEVLYTERSWTYLKVLFESLFSLTEVLNMAVFQNYEIILGQTVNYFADFRNCMQCHIFAGYLYYCFIKGIFNIRDTNTAAKKYSRLYRSINLFIFRIYDMS
jgi:hypothetical protein